MVVCVCGQGIYRLCSSQKCQHPAEFCDDRACLAYLNHIRCPSIIYPVCLDIQSQIQRNEREFIRKVNLVMFEFAEQVKLTLNQTVQRKHYKKFGKAIKKIKRDGRVRERRIVGREVKEAWDEVKDFGDTRQLYEKCYEQFRGVMEGFRNSILEQRLRFLSRMVGEESSPQEIVIGDQSEANNSPLQLVDQNQGRSEAQLQSPSQEPIQPRPKLARLFQPESQIGQFLTQRQNYKDFFLQSFDGKKVKSVQKVFTASARQNMVDGKRSPSELFGKCGDLKNPLMVVKYIYKPFNEIFLFGAWTPLSLGDGKTKVFKHDPTYQSRLYWFNQRLVFPLKNEGRQNNNALYTDIDFGLIFGIDLDIKSEGTRTKRINIGNRYSISHLSHEQGQRLKLCQQKMSKIYKGEVLDYQVYQLEFEEEPNGI